MIYKAISMLLACLLLAISSGNAQVPDSGQEVSGLVEQYKEEASSLVYFLEYALNVLGDPAAATAEKEVIINESYLKVFRDEKVQIEDDLVPRRGVVTYKDIPAYLKDVNFFFKEAHFEFTIDEVTHHFSEDNQLYFLVTMTRHLKGLSVEGDSIYNTRQRFVELNLDEQERLLKIVSIYTTKLSEQETLKSWWNNMTADWQMLFAPNVQVSEKLNMAEVLAQRPDIKLADTLFIPQNDTLSDTLLLDNPLIYNSLKHILAQEELDLSGRVLLRSLKPLSKFTRLKRLNISKTLISDLVPLRNLTQLEMLDCSSSPVIDLSPLRYAINMRELYLQRTQIADLSPVANFSQLEILDCRYTPVQSLKPLAGLKYLTDLRCSHTPIDDLDGLSGVQALKTLHLSHTKIRQLDPLRMLNGLEQLQIDHTEISNLGPIAYAKELRVLYADNTRLLSLEPLGGLENLTKVYCDNTPIPKSEATRFMLAHPRILVVYQSTALTKWWTDLPGEWKTVLRRYAPLDEMPNKEQLQLLVNVDTINLDGNRQITSLEPLKEFRSLLQLRCRWTGISSLGPIRELRNLELLDCSHTRVNSLAPIGNLTNLRELYLQETAISGVEALAPLTKIEILDLSQTATSKFEPLLGMERLRLLYADGTPMDEVRALHLMTELEEVLVVFKSTGLAAWWESLLPTWKGIFQAHVNVSSPPAPEELHQMAYLEKVTFSDNPAVLDLSPLLGLLRLKELTFDNTRIISLAPLSRMTDLEVLQCSQSPITDLMPVSNLRSLRELDCSNTPVEDLEPIEALIQLEALNVAGTQIRDLKDLRSLVHLQKLNCSNTDVKTLKHINGLKNLKAIQCFNTRIPASQVQEYKLAHEGTKVVHY